MKIGLNSAGKESVLSKDPLLLLLQVREVLILGQGCLVNQSQLAQRRRLLPTLRLSLSVYSVPMHMEGPTQLTCTNMCRRHAGPSCILLATT